MAKVKCIACERIHDIKALEAHEGFAACPHCHALFDVTQEVVKRAPRGAAEFWAHGELRQPAGVDMVIHSVEISGLNDGYRNNARTEARNDALWLDYVDNKLKQIRLLGLLVAITLGSSAIYGFHLYRPGRDSRADLYWLIPFVVPALIGVYSSLVGFVNRVRIRVDSASLRIDQGPLPWPHKKLHVQTKNIRRLTCHWTTKQLKNAIVTEYEIRQNAAAVIVDDLDSPEVGVYIQHHLAAFLRLKTIGPADLTKDSPARSDDEEAL